MPLAALGAGIALVLVVAVAAMVHQPLSASPICYHRRTVTVLGRRLDVDYVAEAVQISVGGASKRPGAKTGEGHGEVLVSR